PVSDGWFPTEPAALNQVLDRSFSLAEQRFGTVPPRKGLLALIAPHAGLAYSGPVAAAAYSRLDRPANVIVLGFSHRVRFNGVLAPRVSTYRTPLGEIQVNGEALRELGFPSAPEDQLCDHSLENQLPFIQRAAPGARIIPLYIGDLTDAQLSAAAGKLAARLRLGDVIVASSDFTHYGKPYGYTPFANNGKLAQHLRERFLESAVAIGALNVPAFDTFLRSTNENLCGWAPIRLLMASLRLWKEDVFLSPLDYMTSGEITGDWSASVSYGALAFYPYGAYALSPASRTRLLESARRTLTGYLANGGGQAKPVPAERNAELDQRAGVFVTIKKRGELRGCVGDIAARQPLWSAVSDRALEAATADPRFPPLSLKEGPVSLEISILTPVKKVADWEEFKVGQGVILQLKGRSATFLPQVPVEMGWTREQTLEELAKKAGLPPGAYRDPNAVLHVYSAHVFGDD
ncbi:MAG TPA: AmmeMemoRadiSam system protein B, partial [Bryobacteraceae bacterium]|nr:AmmeMemoRadiSam system protein B [Bryobacteraceae bacterium]